MGHKALVPFWMRRPWLVARGIVTNREQPDFDALARIDDPERFVWAILPHAARTFSACIALLPARAALPAAIAYLYCRMLDTYEDLVPERAEREASLRAFAARFDAASGDAMQPAPPIRSASDRDDRDRAHLLLVERAVLVDRAYAALDPATKRAVRDLVRDMSDGMVWSSATLADQGGVLEGEEQIVAYCRHVLANPVAFTMCLLRLGVGRTAVIAPDERDDAHRVGEMLQLANITRDVEKDLRRGIAYDASLRADLGRDVTGDAAATERVRLVRERLLRMALRCAPSYGRMVDAMRLPRVSVARASAVVMLLFTERYFRGCARRVGLPTWPGSKHVAAILVNGVLAAASRRHAAREIARVQRVFLACAGEAAP
ncbi:MAG TPA: squalene/phytoene synthase family protein [Gemmatimonadaceae bacterium]|nr:squalene/phytoene synthase family protein [Gemmatimonadaceae bacterium]